MSLRNKQLKEHVKNLQDHNPDNAMSQHTVVGNGDRNQVTPMWQLCPKCDGEPKGPDGLKSPRTITLEGHSVSTLVYCDLCNDKKIICVITGKPPK